LLGEVLHSSDQGQSREGATATGTPARLRSPSTGLGDHPRALSPQALAVSELWPCLASAGGEKGRTSTSRQVCLAMLTRTGSTGRFWSQQTAIWCRPLTRSALCGRARELWRLFRQGEHPNTSSKWHTAFSTLVKGQSACPNSRIPCKHRTGDSSGDRRSGNRKTDRNSGHRLSRPIAASVTRGTACGHR